MRPPNLSILRTSDISPKLVPILERWFWSYYSSDEIKTELDKVKCPANCPSLIPVKINEESVWSIFSTPAPGKDLTPRFIHNAFMKASQLLTFVWAQIIQLETFCKKQEQPMVLNLENGISLDFVEIHKSLDQSLHLLGIANSQMVQLRKDILKPFLNDDFKKLCCPHIPFSQWMFGDDFKKIVR